MALLFFNRLHQQNLDATDDFSAGDTTGTLNSTATFTADAAIIGTVGLDCPTSADTIDFAISSHDIVHRDQGCIGFLFRFATFVAGPVLTVSGTAPNDNLTFELTGTDEILFRHRVSGVTNLTVATTVANLAVNTPYFVVGRWRDSDNSRAIEVYNGTTGALIDSTTSTASAFGQQTDLINFRIGPNNGIDGHYKNTFVADTYDEAIEDFFDILSYTEYGGIDYTLTVDHGQMVMQGQSSTFATGMAITHGQLVAHPSPVNLLFDEAFVLPVVHGQFCAEGQDIPFILSQPGTAGQFVFQGSDVTLSALIILPVDAGQFVFEGQTVGLTLDETFVLSVDHGQYVIQGSVVTLTATGADVENTTLVFALPSNLVTDLTEKRRNRPIPHIWDN